MKIIITESQINNLWIIRRYSFIKKLLDNATHLVNPCDYETSEKYIVVILSHTMDGLHSEYNMIDDFDYLKAIKNIFDFFRSELEQVYIEGKKNCS